MSDHLPNNRALLPAGLRDLLPPEAETEASAVEVAHGSVRRATATSVSSRRCWNSRTACWPAPAPRSPSRRSG